MHYIELDVQGRMSGIYPLEGEIAGTEFYGGILIPVVRNKQIFHPGENKISFKWQPNFSRIEVVADTLAHLGVSEGVSSGMLVDLYLLSGITLTAAEFRTDNSSSNGYIKRL
ncbi:hypothetical protein DW103_15695 [Parabacteroides sp. AM08-6]|nr:hypothetical protein DW103_15695 [Parabacteroides sp. AM08-6]